MSDDLVGKRLLGRTGRSSRSNSVSTVTPIEDEVGVAVQFLLDPSTGDSSSIGQGEGKIPQLRALAEQALTILLLVMPVGRAAMTANLVGHALNVAAGDSGDPKMCLMSLRDCGQ